MCIIQQKWQIVNYVIVNEERNQIHIAEDCKTLCTIWLYCVISLLHSFVFFVFKREGADFHHIPQVWNHQKWKRVWINFFAPRFCKWLEIVRSAITIYTLVASFILAYLAIRTFHWWQFLADIIELGGVSQRLRATLSWI